MKVIDFRFRPSTAEFLSSTNNRLHSGLIQSKGEDQFKVIPLDKTVKLMDDNNIIKAVVQGRDVETTFGWKVSNDHVSEVVKKSHNRFIGFAGIDPNKGMDAISEIERAVCVLGLRGVSIDPYMHKKFANDKKLYPIYSKCVELGVPVIITTGPAPSIPETLIEHSSPSTIDEIATDFPELKIISSHGGYPWVLEMITVAERHENVFFDISAYELKPGADMYVEAANSVISDKILFASAHPFTHIEESLKRYSLLAFEREVREKVMYGNAARLLDVSIEK